MGASQPDYSAGKLGQWPRAWLIALVLLACFVFLYLQTFILPDIPRFPAGDQSIYLHHAERMREGQIIYRDYDHFTLPGTDVLYCVLFRIFGVRLWIPGGMLVLIGLLMMWLSIGISRQLMTGPAIFLSGIVFLALPYSSYLDATHHWYSALAEIAALSVVTRSRTTPRLVVAGVLWGLATFFTQSAGLGIVGLIIFLIWERSGESGAWKALLTKEAYLLGSFVLTVSSLNVYFLWQVGLRRFLYYTVIFGARYFPADQYNNWRIYMTGWPSLHHLTNWPDLLAFPFIHLLIPLVYILFFARYWLQAHLQPEIPWDRLMLVNLTGIALFLSISFAPSYTRLYTVALPALILLVWFLQCRWRLERVLLYTLWVVSLSLSVIKPSVAQTRWAEVLKLPIGRAAFIEPDFYEKFKWVAQRTKPGEYFFGDPSLCFALRLQNPTRVPFVRPNGYTRPEEVQNVVEALETHEVRFVSWYDGLDHPSNPATDPLGPLRFYLKRHYHVSATFSNFDKIWELNQEN
jgi:hypothetical protein